MSTKSLIEVKGLGKATADKLLARGIRTITDLVRSDTPRIMEITGFGENRTALILASARGLLEETTSSQVPSVSEGVRSSVDKSSRGVQAQSQDPDADETKAAKTKAAKKKKDKKKSEKKKKKKNKEKRKKQKDKKNKKKKKKNKKGKP